mmetsp:Transcript_14121/g.39981  ORF Transcript_14121/g.39981 Transcript_14121/m.39981 type:complete len:123 (+) Transcript_14121:2661-3029(+)
MELLLLEKPREARTRGLARAVARRAAAWYLVLVMDAAAALATNINQPINQSINQSKRERERERGEKLDSGSLSLARERFTLRPARGLDRIKQSRKKVSLPFLPSLVAAGKTLEEEDKELKRE